MPKQHLFSHKISIYTVIIYFQIAKLLQFSHCFRYHAREMSIFERMNFGCHIMSSIAWLDRTGSLEYDVTIVEELVDIMNGDSRLCVATCYDIFVNAVAIHPLAAMQRDERRMDIDDGIWIGIDQIFRNEQQISRKDNKVDTILIVERHNVVDIMITA